MKNHLIDEIWKDIKGYEGLYQASTLGEIRRTESVVVDKNKKRIRKFKNKIIKQILRKDGYYFVNLSKNGKVKTAKVHRLIAETFLKNDKNYNIINHKDGNKKNNNITNLEWCSCSHNNKEAYRLGLRKPTILKGALNGSSKSVLQYDTSNNFIKKWSCIKEASKELKIKDSNISLVCKGKRNKAGGYKWKYKD